MRPNAFPPALQPWIDIGLMLGEAAVDGTKQSLAELRPRRRGSYRTRRPGAETPAWNACSGLLREELKFPGAKARLARYLGIPRQRLSDFLSSRRRLPDAELALQMIHWLAQKRAGKDLSL